MDVWNSKKWRDNRKNKFAQRGLYFRVEKDVNPEVRRATLEFAKWLRKEYVFPARVNVYIKSDARIRVLNGEMVCSTCFRPFNKEELPYIRIATGDYDELVEKRGKDNALATILCDIIRMLTHYYQWLNFMDNLTEKQEERQANIYARKIINNYAKTRDHP